MTRQYNKNKKIKCEDPIQKANLLIQDQASVKSSIIKSDYLVRGESVK